MDLVSMRHLCEAYRIRYGPACRICHKRIQMRYFPGSIPKELGLAGLRFAG